MRCKPSIRANVITHSFIFAVAGIVACGGAGASRAQSGTAQNSNNAADASALACPNDANDTYAPARIACVQAINTYRAQLNLAPYQRWCDASTCIDEQATADSASQNAHGAFGDCRESAQNECPGWPTPVPEQLTRCLAQMWAEGPGTDFSQHGHYLNMSSTRYTRVECGVSVAGDSFWATIDFQ